MRDNIHGKPTSYLQNIKRLALLFGLPAIVLLIHSCKCTTEFIASNDATPGYDDEYRLTCYIREGAYAEEDDKLMVEFHFCSYPAFSPPCPGKKLINGSVTIVPELEGENSRLIPGTVYSSCYSFTSKNFKQLWHKADKLKVRVTYKVDSLGTILNREFTHVLTKNKKCREHFVLH